MDMQCYIHAFGKPGMADKKSVFETQLEAIDAMLDGLPPPEAPSARQLVIASRGKIHAKLAAGQRLETIRDGLAAIGFDIKLNTLRDYLYNGEASKGARTATRAIKTRKVRKPSPMAETTPAPVTSFVLPADATEATAGGGPVRARKML